MPKRFLAILISLMVLLAACQSPAVTNTPRPGRTRTRVPSGSPTTLPQDTATVAPTTAATDSSAASTPQPTFDFQGFILTQAYSKFTPPPGSTPQPQSTIVTPSGAVTSSVPLDTATPHFSAPAAVIVSGPVSISNAINKATCVINGVGDCTPTISLGASVYVTWTLGIQGSQAFKWGNAAVVFQKDGKQFKWLQANNSAQKPPEAGQISTLAVGDQAIFRGGLDNIQPGAYSAKLVICLASVEQCNAGAGWQDVGGDTVRFAVNP
jgi:hypothetical protein